MMISGLVKWMWGFVVSDDEPKKQIKRLLIISFKCIFKERKNFIENCIY